METNASPWNGKRVLVVDDSAWMRDEISGIYETMGLHIIGSCQNGVEAIEEYSKLKPDLISLDIIMPEMDGIECYRELVKIDPSIKIIFVSCLSSNAIFINSLKDEIPGYLFLNKPLHAESLAHSLSKIYIS